MCVLPVINVRLHDTTGVQALRPQDHVPCCTTHTIAQRYGISISLKILGQSAEQNRFI